MAVKISALPAAIAAAAANIFAVVQSGTTRQVALSAIAAWVQQTYAGFTQTGSGAVANTPEDTFQQLPWVNLLDFCSDVKRAAIIAGTQTDVTAELILAAATRKTVVMPKGLYGVTSSVSFESRLVGAGPYSAGSGTYILLTSTGQLTFDQQGAGMEGCYIECLVNTTTFLKVTAQRVRLHNFTLVGIGALSTGQIGIEVDTMQGATAGAVSFLDFDHFKITGIWTCMKTTDTSYCNGNKFGSASCNWSGFTRAFHVANTGGCGANTIDGYFESSQNPHAIILVGAGAVFSNSNIIPGWFDAVGGSAVNLINNSGTVGRNIWTRATPDQTSGIVGTVNTPQIFTDKCRARATMSGDQVGITNTTSVKVLFDTETYDEGSIFNLATDRFELFRVADIEITARVKIGGNIAAGNFLLLSIFKNGVSAAIFETYAVGTSAETLEITESFRVAINDYFEIFIRADGSGTHTVTAAASSVSLKEI